MIARGTLSLLSILEDNVSRPEPVSVCSDCPVNCGASMVFRIPRYSTLSALCTSPLDAFGACDPTGKPIAAAIVEGVEALQAPAHRDRHKHLRNEPGRRPLEARRRNPDNGHRLAVDEQGLVRTSRESNRVRQYNGSIRRPAIAPRGVVPPIDQPSDRRLQTCNTPK